MKKRILCMLVVFCMIIGLCPVLSVSAAEKERGLVTLNLSTTHKDQSITGVSFREYKQNGCNDLEIYLSWYRFKIIGDYIPGETGEYTRIIIHVEQDAELVDGSVVKEPVYIRGNNGRISGGEYNTELYNPGVISGGIFNGSVWGSGPEETYITGGSFYNEVHDGGAISGGTFYKTVYTSNMNTRQPVTGGIFKDLVYNVGGTISGGTFYDKVTNEMSGEIKGGRFFDDVNNLEHSTISGGVFEGTVTVDDTSSITDGTFNGAILNNGSVTFPVSLHTEGGKISQNETVKTFTYQAKTPVLLPANVEKKGYVFKGWYTNENYIGTPCDKIDTSVAGAKEYWAKWECSHKQTIKAACEDQICDICGETIEGFGHRYNNKLYYEPNGTEHWYICNVCGQKVGVTKHTYDQKVIDQKYLISSKTTASPDKYIKSCICGASAAGWIFTVGEPKKDDSSQKPVIKPAKKGTVLTIKNKKLKVKVTSSSVSKPTVTVIGSTSKKISSVSIPATVKVNGITYNVTGISDKAFYKYSSLTKVTIPASVTMIGKKAFANSKKLATVTIKSEKLTKKKVGSQAFVGISSKAVFKVPAKKLKAYQSLLKTKGMSKKAVVKTWKK